MGALDEGSRGGRNEGRERKDEKTPIKKSNSSKANELSINYLRGNRTEP